MPSSGGHSANMLAIGTANARRAGGSKRRREAKRRQEMPTSLAIRKLLLRAGATRLTKVSWLMRSLLSYVKTCCLRLVSW